LKCSFIMNTTRDCTCNRLFLVITMLRNLNMHIEIYLYSWSFDTTFFLEMAYILFIGYRSSILFCILCKPNISIGLHRCYIFSHELIITCIFLSMYGTGTCGQDPMLLPFFLKTFFHINNILQLSMYHCMTYTGADPGGGASPGARHPPPLKLEKIRFVYVKSWFFTRNTPSARRNFFKCAPPNLKSWIRPWYIQ
jgi:hypothetical protein